MEEATGPSQAPPLLPPSKVNPYAAYLHDAVLLYAEILMEVVTAGSDFRDGRRLVISLKGSSRPRCRVSDLTVAGFPNSGQLLCPWGLEFVGLVITEVFLQGASVF